MIKINLLPQEITGGKGGAQAAQSSPGDSKALVVFVLVLLFAANAAGGFWMFKQRSESIARTKSLDEQSKGLKAQLAKRQQEYQELKASLDTLTNQIAVLKSLDPEDRLFWAQKLNMLPLLVPDGVFITKLQISENVEQKETVASQKKYQEWTQKGSKGAPPAHQTKPSITQILDVYGVSYVSGNATSQRLNQILEFLRALQGKMVKLPFSKDKELSFMDHFNEDVTFSPFELGQVGNREVSTFRFTFKSKPITAEE